MLLIIQKPCFQCQKANPKISNDAPEFHPVAVSNCVMKQIAIDICKLLEVDGFKYIAVAIE